MSPFLRIIAGLAVISLLVSTCLIFPRVLGFFEMALRELRYIWWLVLIAAFGIWLAFFSGGKKSK